MTYNDLLKMPEDERQHMSLVCYGLPEGDAAWDVLVQEASSQLAAAAGKIRIVPRSKSWVISVLSLLLFWAKDFKTSAWTTIPLPFFGNWIFAPDAAIGKRKHAHKLAHELQHVADAAYFGQTLYAFLYLLLPPAGPGARGLFELRAMMAEMIVYSHINFKAPDNDWIEQQVSALAGPFYLFAMPFKGSVREHLTASRDKMIGLLVSRATEHGQDLAAAIDKLKTFFDATKALDGLMGDNNVQ